MKGIKWEFFHPLKKGTEIGNFQIEYAYGIPGDLKALLEKHNGGVPDKQVFDSPREGMVFANLLSFNKDDAETVHMVLGHFLEDGRLTMLPFGTDGFGNLICCKKGGEIVFWNHESGLIEHISNDIKGFMDMLHL